MAYSVSVKAGFSAAHSLRDYKGQCERLHGHNYEVVVDVTTDSVDPSGFVVDFRDLKKVVGGVLEHLDHQHLNEVKPFTKINPTAENLARWIHDQLEARLSDRKLRLARVTVFESPGSSASYSAG